MADRGEKQKHPGEISRDGDQTSGELLGHKIRALLAFFPNCGE
jgi:hypothetical protein